MILGGVGVLVLAVLIAVAAPVFLQERDRARQQPAPDKLSVTSVSLPPTVAGLTKIDDPATSRLLAEAARSVQPSGSTEPLLMSLYRNGAGTHRILLTAGRSSIGSDPAAQRSFSDNMWAGFRDSASGFTVGAAVAAYPGRLGGMMTCAPITAGSTGRVCVSVDNASFVVMVEFGPATDPALPTAVREAVVHRT